MGEEMADYSLHKDNILEKMLEIWGNLRFQLWFAYVLKGVLENQKKTKKNNET